MDISISAINDFNQYQSARTSHTVLGIFLDGEGTRRSRSFPLKGAPEKMTYRKYTVGLAVLIASGASIYLTSRYYRLKIAVKERVDRAKRFIFVLGLGGLAISGLYLFTRAKRALRVTSIE